MSSGSTRRWSINSEKTLFDICRRHMLLSKPPHWRGLNSLWQLYQQTALWPLSCLLHSYNLCHAYDSLMGCTDVWTSYCAIRLDNLSDIIPAHSVWRASFHDLNAWYILYSVEKNLWHRSPRHGPLCLVAFCAGRHIYSHSLPALALKCVCACVSTSASVCAALWNVAICLASTPFLLIKFGG